MEKILEINNLNKKQFSKQALEDVNLSLEKGRILGLMGPNGSGKTTLLKIIAGLQHANSGNVKVCGKNIGIETKKDAGEVIAKAMELGVLPLKAKNKVRLLPPLNISKENLEKAIDEFSEGKLRRKDDEEKYV